MPAASPILKLMEVQAGLVWVQQAPACYVSVVLVASGRVPVPCVVRLAVGPATNSNCFIERSCQSLPSFACWSAGRTFHFQSISIALLPIPLCQRCFQNCPQYLVTVGRMWKCWWAFLETSTSLWQHEAPAPQSTHTKTQDTVSKSKLIDRIWQVSFSAVQHCVWFSRQGAQTGPTKYYLCASYAPAMLPLWLNYG